MKRYEFTSLMSAIWFVGSLSANTTLAGVGCLLIGIIWFILGLVYKNKE